MQTIKYTFTLAISTLMVACAAPLPPVSSGWRENKSEWDASNAPSRFKASTPSQYNDTSGAWGQQQFASTKSGEVQHNLSDWGGTSSHKPALKQKNPPDSIFEDPITNSDIDSIPTSNVSLNSNSYAIIIGIERYRQKLPNADFAVNDAKLVSLYFTKALGYSEENVVTLTNENATKGDLEKYLGSWLKNNVNKDGNVFIYFSGHGAPNPKNGDAYLVPYDGDPTFIVDTGYPLNKLYENLAKLNVKHVVVALDACFSGAGGKSVLAKGARPLVMNMEKNQFHRKKIAVLAAASGDQISSSYEEKRHGVFTYFFLKGIKEQLAQNKSAKLELGALYDYLKPQVESVSRKKYNSEQTPQLILGDDSLKRIGLIF
jgi:Caspase domain